MAALDSSFAEMASSVSDACDAAGGDWQKGVEAGLAALLAFVAEHPAPARMCMVEAISATPAASARYEDAVHQFVELLRLGTPRDTGLSETIEETLIGGVAWILQPADPPRRSGSGDGPAARTARSSFFLRTAV